MIEYSPHAVQSSIHPDGPLARGFCRDVSRSCVIMEINIEADPAAIRCSGAAVTVAFDIVSLMFQQ
jgi:hypothetical protein